MPSSVFNFNVRLLGRFSCDGKSVVVVTDIFNVVFVTIYWIFVLDLKTIDVMVLVVIKHVIDCITTRREQVPFESYVLTVNDRGQHVIVHSNTSVQQFYVMPGTRGIFMKILILDLFTNKSIVLQKILFTK